MSVTQCLLESIRVIRKMDLDPDVIESLEAGLRRVIERQYETLQHQMNAANIAVWNAERRALAAKLAQAADLRAIELLESDLLARDPSKPETVAAAANRIRRLLSPEPGDVGLPNRAPVSSLLRAEIQDMDASLGDVWALLVDRYGKTGILKMKDSERAVAFDLALRGGKVDDPEIKAAVAKFREVIEPRLMRLREAGVWTEVIKNWAWQTHNNSRIEADRTAWRDFLVKNLDPRHHPDPQATVDALYERLFTREFENTGSGQVGARRKIWFRSPEAEHEYAMKYGDPGIARNAISAIRRIAEDVVIAEELMPNPGKLKKTTEGVNGPLIKLRADIERMPERTRKERKLKKRAQSDAKWASDLLDALQMNPGDPADRTANNLIAMMRMGAAALRLGKSTLSQVVEDPVRAAVFGRFDRDGPFKALRAFGGHFLRVVEVADKHSMLGQVMRMHGGTNNAVIASSLNRLAMEVTPEARLGAASLSERAAARAAAMQNFTMRFSLSQAVEQIMRGGELSQVELGMAKQVQKSWNDLHPEYRRRLFENRGITAAEWEIIRNWPLNQMGLIDLEGIKAEYPKIGRKLYATYLREADLRIVLPDLETRFLVNFGWLGSSKFANAARLITQFLAFPTALYRNGFMREWKTSTMAGAQATASMVLSSAIKIQLYAAVGGLPLFAWDSVELWKRAFLNSGVLHPLVQLAGEAVLDTRASIPGVVPSTLRDFGTTIVGGVEDAFDGDTDELAGKAVRLGRQFVPNWWQIDYIVNTTLDAILEEIDPDFIRRRNRRWEREGREVE